MLGNYLQQTTSADDIFRCIFFLALLGLNVCENRLTSYEKIVRNVCANSILLLQAQAC